MPDPSDGNTALLSAAAAVAAAIFAGVAACFSIFYHLLTRAKLKAEMHKEYGDLFQERTKFWKNMRICYNRKVQECQKSNEGLSKFALRIGPPYVEGDVAQWARRNELKNPESNYFQRNTSHRQMWELVSYIYYPEKQDILEMFMGEKTFTNEEGSTTRLPSDSEFHSVRGKLAWFWDKWTPLLRRHFIRKYSYLTKRYDSAESELYLLAWLEVALALKVDAEGKGKVDLFKLAQKFHSKR